MLPAGDQLSTETSKLEGRNSAYPPSEATTTKQAQRTATKAAQREQRKVGWWRASETPATASFQVPPGKRFLTSSEVRSNHALANETPAEFRGCPLAGPWKCPCEATPHGPFCGAMINKSACREKDACSPSSPGLSRSWVEQKLPPGQDVCTRNNPLVCWAKVGVCKPIKAYNIFTDNKKISAWQNLMWRLWLRPAGGKGKDTVTRDWKMATKLAKAQHGFLISLGRQAMP